MRKRGLITILLVFLILFSSAACGEGSAMPSGTSATQKTEAAQNRADDTLDRKVLIAYFSRADENYAVGVIEKGNTQIVAEIIAEETGGELFHIQTAIPYPANYDECTDVAKQEQAENARPELRTQVRDLKSYDTVYLGFPIWWGDMPMAVYTFLESNDFEGKTIIPFSTHAGSGLAGTVDSIKKSCPLATVLDGFTVSGADAQNKQADTRNLVTHWLQHMI